MFGKEKKTKQTSDGLTYDTGSLLTTDVARLDAAFPACTDSRLLQNSREDAASRSTSMFEKNLAIYNTKGLSQLQMNPE